MKRETTITLPYTFCLFAAVVSVVGLACAVSGLWYAYDRHQARPTLAHAVLSRALDDVQHDLAKRFDPALAHLRTVRQWLAQGELSADAIDAWPVYLLPQLAPQEGVRALAVVDGGGIVWRAARERTGWSGAWRDAGDLDGPWSAATWDRFGHSPKPGRVSDPQKAARYGTALSALHAPGQRTQGGVYVEVGLDDDGRETVLLAVATATSGVPGILALELESPLPHAAEPDVLVEFDPGGRRMARLERSQTAALLTTRAIPAMANVALRSLFTSTGDGTATRWVSARAFPIGGDFTWWSVASIDEVALPLPALPLTRYAFAGLGAGLAGALVLSLTLGGRISAPLARIVRRANSIRAVDEHYLPWPTSRFTEVNALTSALEDLYESAVEHLDYHEAPLVVWAQHEALSGDDGIVDAQPLKRHINLRGGDEAAGAGPDGGPGEEPGTVINVRGEAPVPAVPAAQIQVLLGSRREVRRLQGQLSGVCEELRTASTHFQQGETRLKRQRDALRALDKALQRDSAVTAASLAIIRDCLGARVVSLWRLKSGQGAPFALRISTEDSPDATPIAAGIVLRSLLREELVVATRDLQGDPRLADLKSHPQWAGRPCCLLLAPLRFRGTVLGFIVIENGSAKARWKADEEAFAANSATQCTMVLGANHRNGIARTGQPEAHRNGYANGSGTPSFALEEAGTIHWETDLAGCIKALRGDVAALYGYPAEALIGQPITFLSGREAGERDLAQWRIALSGAPCVGHESHHQRADGTALVLAVRAEAQRDATGRIVGVRGTAVPVTVAAH